MIKLLQYFIKDKWADIEYCCRKPQISRLLIRYSIFSLLIIFSIFGLFKIIERQQIKTQLKTQIRISQILKEFQDTQQVIEANQVREDAIKKVSKIISRYNSLDAHTLRAYANEIFKMTIRYDNLDIELISATITHESAWNFKAKSYVGALGLMQIMPGTGKMLANKENIEWTNAQDMLFNPIINIRLGSRYLSYLISVYEPHMNRDDAIEASLAAYNGGQRRVRYWISKRRNYDYLWEETRTYIPRVLGLRDKFVSM